MRKSMLEVLTNKYENLADFTSQFSFVEYKYGSTPPNSKRRSNLFRTNSGNICVPPIVVLENCKISCLGDNKELFDLCNHLCELDLSYNELTSWRDVLTILARCPKLEWLNVSFNKYLTSTDPLEDISLVELPTLSSLRTLILNNIETPWSILSYILNHAPSLEEFHLCCNNLSSMCDLNQEITATYPNVKSLFLNGNQFTSYESFVQLGQLFPNLEKLTLLGNGITSLPDDTSFTVYFAKLTSLNLSMNDISKYEDVDKLNDFESLCDIHLSENSLLANAEFSEEEFRAEIVSRLPKITILNKTPITSMERTNAERAFIRHYMQSDCPPSQFEDLQNKHGKLEPLAEVDLKPPETVEVMLSYDDSQKRTYSMPVSFSSTEVKKTVCQLFACSPTKSKLFHRSCEGGIMMEMKFSQRPFHTFKPEDGDELLLY